MPRGLQPLPGPVAPRAVPAAAPGAARAGRAAGGAVQGHRPAAVAPGHLWRTGEQGMLRPAAGAEWGIDYYGMASPRN
eukprot:6803741-Pyramimonas_sp.AAC.1